jgi:ABC-2 type transport system permease protein
MNVSRLLDKVLVVLHRELLATLRTRFGLLFEVLVMFAEIAGFYFLARAIGPQFRPDGVDYFRFVLIGTALMGLLVTGTSTFVGAIHDAQMTGGMEYLMTTASGGPLVIALLGMATFIDRAIRVALLFAVAALFFHLRLPGANVGAFLVIYFLSVLVTVGIGLLGAAAQIATHRGNAVAWVAGAATGLLTGAFFPISALPSWLQRLAMLIPITHSLNGIRMALLRGAGLGSMQIAVAVLAGYALILLPLSIAVLQTTLQKARRAGTLALH